MPQGLVKITSYAERHWLKEQLAWGLFSLYQSLLEMQQMLPLSLCQEPRRYFFIMCIVKLTGLMSIQASDYWLKQFKEAGCPHHDLIGTAQINTFSPLIVGRFAWAFFDDEVVLTQDKCFHPTLLAQPN